MLEQSGAVGPLLAVRDLKYRYPGRSGGRWRRSGEGVLAVDQVAFDLGESETLAVVGESGSGKSTLAYCVMRLLQPQGQILFLGNDLVGLSMRQMRPLRRHLQIVFQDPYSSLNPRMSVQELLAEPLRIHGKYPRRNSPDHLLRDALDHVALPYSSLRRHPHEFSGGQRQRIAIARALILRPQILICDEPVSSLDVSVQAQIINLLLRLQEELSLSYLFISHDLAVVSSIAHRIAIMHGGRFVETGPTSDIFAHPSHEYTQELLAAAPDIEVAVSERLRAARE